MPLADLPAAEEPEQTSHAKILGKKENGKVDVKQTAENLKAAFLAMKRRSRIILVAAIVAAIVISIVTTALKHATDFKRNAEVGMVMVNLPTAGVDYHVPFGGRKGSSHGPREQGASPSEFYTTVKTAYVLA